MEERRKMLVEALKTQGLSLRSDSKLCKDYINFGECGEWTITNVVQRMAQMRFLHDFTNYGGQCDKEIEAELAYKGNLSSVGGSQEICAGVEEEVLTTLPSGTWPWRWPWLPALVWTPSTHNLFSPTFKRCAREVILCMSICIPLRDFDSNSRNAIINKILSMAAPAHVWMDPWLPQLYNKIPNGISNKRRKRWHNEKPALIRDFVRRCAQAKI